MNAHKSFIEIDKYVDKFGNANRFVQKIIDCFDCLFAIVNADSLDVEVTNDKNFLRGAKCFDLFDCPNCKVDDISCVIKRVVNDKKAIIVKNEGFLDAPLEIHAHPIFNSKGKVESVILYKFDISKFLIDHKKRFRDFFEFDSRGMLMYELGDGNEFSLIDINSSAKKILNIDSKKIKGENIKETFPGIIDACFFDKCYKIASVGGFSLIPDILSSHKKINRSYDFFIFQVSPNNIIISFSDITKRKEMEKIAKQKKCFKEDGIEQKYKALFEQAVDSITLSDTITGKFLDFNENAYKHLGYTKEEFSKLKISDIEAMEGLKEVKKHIKNIRKKGKDFFETKHRRKDGKISDVLVSVKIINIGGKKYQQSIWKDITEKKELKKELRRGQERFYNILQNSQDLVYRYNYVNNNFDYVSESVFIILGYSLGEFMKMTMDDYNKRIHPDDLKLIECDETSEQESVSNVQYRFKKKDGIYIWLNVKRVFFRDEYGEIIHSIEDLKDITSKKLMEKENSELGERISRIRNKFSETKDRISLNDKEKLVLWGLCRHPLLNDEELAKKLDLKRSTLTAIKNRMKEKNWFNFNYIPNFHKLGCQFFSILDMKFKGSRKDILNFIKEAP